MNVVPTHKNDFDACDNLQSASDREVIKHLEELIEWTRDMNWPVAGDVLKRLSDLGLPLVNPINRILNSNDAIWKYWVLFSFLPRLDKETARYFIPVLSRINEFPTAAEQEEDLDTLASVLLNELEKPELVSVDLETVQSNQELISFEVEVEYKEILENYQKTSDAIRNVGGEILAYTIQPPASLAEVVDLEKKLTFALPNSFKEVLLNFAKAVEFNWFFPDDFELEKELSELFSGERVWSIDDIIELNKAKDKWVETFFSNKDDSHDAVWHNKLAFQAVGDGDYLAIDLKDPNREPVVYLSHDDDDWHGIELAKTFKEFLFVSSRLGCVGGESWQMRPFIENGKPYLNADCANARRFRRVLDIAEYQISVT